MSRIARKPLEVPKDVNVLLEGHRITVKGKKGEFNHTLDGMVQVIVEGNLITVKPKKELTPMVGTTVKMIKNMVQGVSTGFERKLQLVGVGYRAKTQGNILELALGFSHPVLFPIPKGITIETPSNTEITIKGSDPQLVGEIAAKIRAVRPPEPYKGKGVRYLGEVIELKETKKK